MLFELGEEVIGDFGSGVMKPVCDSKTELFGICKRARFVIGAGGADFCFRRAFLASRQSVGLHCVVA